MSASGKAVVAAVITGLVLAGTSHGHGHGTALTSAAHRFADAGAARRAIAYARAQEGKAYCWGGTGPSCYDCSGLVMEAYRAAGISIPRTAGAQWAGLPHDSRPRPGDLVFAPGGDGTWSVPGHVGLVIRGGRVLQSYAPGTPVGVSSLAAFAAGAGGIVGYARPEGA